MISTLTSQHFYILCWSTGNSQCFQSRHFLILPFKHLTSATLGAEVVASKLLGQVHFDLDMTQRYKKIQNIYTRYKYLAFLN